MFQQLLHQGCNYMDKGKFIKDISAFKDFTDNAIKKLIDSLESETCNAGDIIFNEGDASDYLYIVESGEVEISKKISPESEKTLTILGPGSIFGEMSLFSTQPRTATAKAKTNACYFKIHKKGFHTLFKNEPSCVRKMLESLLLSTLERLEQTSRELATVYEISRLIAKGLSFKDFCQSVITQICYSVPDIDGGLIYLYNEFTTDYDLGGSVNVQEMAVSIEETHPLIKFLSEKDVTKAPDTMIIQDSEIIGQLLSNVPSLKTLIIAPIVNQEKLIGSILLYAQKEKLQGLSSVRDLLNSVVNQLVSAIENIKTREEEVARQKFDRIQKGTITW